MAGTSSEEGFGSRSFWRLLTWALRFPGKAGFRWRGDRLAAATLRSVKRLRRARQYSGPFALAGGHGLRLCEGGGLKNVLVSTITLSAPVGNLACSNACGAP
jgi:hypothetical protein